MSTLAPQAAACHDQLDTHSNHASGPLSPDAIVPSRTQHQDASGDPLLPEPAMVRTIPKSAPLVQEPSSPDASPLTSIHLTVASGEPLLPPSSQGRPDTQHVRAGGWEYDEGTLLFLTKAVDELEELRKATDSRVRQMTRKTCPACVDEEHDKCSSKKATSLHAEGSCKCGIDKDGQVRGFGLDARSPHVAKAQALAEGVRALEKQAVRDMEKAMREHPLHNFITDTRGLGAKTVARLLAEIGDPYWHPLYERPRTVSELWAFCGLAVNDGRAQARRRGEQANWSDIAKKRVWIIAQPAIKTSGPYRDVYDAARLAYADAVHPHDCIRCGPSGKPALAGSPLSAAHQHARAVRLMCKAILRDLWLAARAVHEASTSQPEGTA